MSRKHSDGYDSGQTTDFSGNQTWSADDPFATAEPIADREPGKHRYELLHEIGRGGLGRVVLARDRVLERNVAIKELQRVSPGARVRFEREMRITAALEHPAVVPVHDAGYGEEGDPFYAMKWVRGQTLEEVVTHCRTIDERVALLPHVIAVGEALAYAHSQGVVHRDLKPQNILVGAFGETVVIDWGLAKQLHEEELAGEEIADQRPNVTRLGAVVGTPSYMSPEQAAGQTADLRSDVFALGALLYSVLTGEPPYDGGSSDELIQLARDAAYRPLRQVDPRVPPELDAIVSKAMAVGPEDRYPTAAELTADLKRFQTGQMVAAYEYSLADHLLRLVARHRMVFATAALSTLLLVGGAAAAFSAILDREQQAQEARAAEVQARQREEARADEVTFEQARLALDHNPARSLALIRELSPSWSRWEAARLVAADAVARGLPHRMTSHAAAVVDVAASADGKRVATGSVDRTVIVHDAVTGAKIAVLEGSPEPIGTVRFSPDGTQVAAASDIVGRVWDARTGKLLHELPGAEDIVAMLEWSPDGTRIAAPSYDGSTRIWSADGTELHVLHGHDDAVLSAAFSPDGSRVLTAGYGRRAVLWDVESGQEVRRWELPDRLQAVIASPTEPVFAAFGEGTIAFLLDGRTGAVHTIEGHDDWIQWLDWSADGTRLATASLDRTVRVWDAKTATLVATLNGHDASVESIDFRPDGSLVSAGSDGRVVVWSASFGKERVFRGHDNPAVAVPVAGGAIVSADLKGDVLRWEPGRYGVHVAHTHEQTVSDLDWTADGKALLSIDQGGAMLLFDRATGTSAPVEAELGYGTGMDAHDNRFVVCGEAAMAVVGADGTVQARFEEPGPLGENCRFAIDGASTYHGLADGSVVIHGLEGHPSHRLAIHEDEVTVLDPSPDGRWLATGAFDNKVALVDLSQDPPTWEVLGEHPSPVLHLSFSLDSRTVYSSGAGGDVKAWPVDRSPGRTLEGGTYINVWLRAGPDGALAAGDAIGGVLLWRDTTKRPQMLVAHSSPVEDLEWHPDGRVLATVSMDGTARLWRVDETEPVSRALVGHAGRLTTQAFSPDGAILATGGEDGAVYLWQDDLPSEPEALRARIGELLSR